MTGPQSAGGSGSQRYRRLPLDLIAVLGFLLLTSATLTLEAGSPVRVVASVITVCFLPGYVTTAALFPSYGPAAAQDRRASPMHARRSLPTRITLRERAALSIGLSVALVPVVAIATVRILSLGTGVLPINTAQFTGGFTTWNTVAMIGGYVTLVAGVAAVRWYRLAPEERFVFPLGSLVTELTGGVSSGSKADRVLTVALVCSILLAGGVFTFALASPMDGERYTDFHLLTTDENGEYVSADYPEELTRGESASLSWGIQSAEADRTEYTVVVQIERVDEQNQRIETVELDRTTETVDPGERVVNDHEITSPLTGENLRVSYYLYRGEAPGTPSEETAYRNLHIWVDVDPAE